MRINREQQIACGLAVFAVIYLIGAWRLPRFVMGSAVVDAHVFPLILGGLLLLLSLVHFATSAGGAERTALLAGVDKPVLLKLVGVTVLYALLLETLGYVVATTVFLAVTMWVLGIRRWLRLSLIAVGFSAVTYGIFVYVLGVPLAQGILPL